MNAPPSVAELVATFLAERGVRRVYGVTGGEVLRPLDALFVRGVEFILTHHEASAAYMADTEGQLSGRPGVCISTLGPGAANLLPGLAQATLERSPVLAITADPGDAERGVRTQQVLDIRGAMQPLVKLRLQVTRENVWQALPAAWEAAGAGRPAGGAAHLAIPASVAADAPVPGAWQVSTPETLAEPDPDAIDDLRERLLAAERPAAVLGLEGRDPAVAAAFQNVVEALELPVATRLKANGWFPGDHPLHAGTVAS